jgi:alkylation response protein AidB-like acyl-CoA dehydrogenase
VGALAMSEPGAGSDVVSMKTTAVKQGIDLFANSFRLEKILYY